MAEVSVSKAAKLSGKSRSTIQRHIKEGKLSAGRNRAGSPVIDVSELLRVYGNLATGETAQTAPIIQHETPHETPTETAAIEALREELRAAKDREEWLKKQLDAERERYTRLENRMLPPGEAPKKGFFKRLFGGNNG